MINLFYVQLNHGCQPWGEQIGERGMERRIRHEVYVRTSSNICVVRTISNLVEKGIPDQRDAPPQQLPTEGSEGPKGLTNAKMCKEIVLNRSDIRFCSHRGGPKANKMSPERTYENKKKLDFVQRNSYLIHHARLLKIKSRA